MISPFRMTDKKNNMRALRGVRFIQRIERDTDGVQSYQGRRWQRLVLLEVNLST